MSKVSIIGFAFLIFNSFNQTRTCCYVEIIPYLKLDRYIQYGKLATKRKPAF
jgi:hypothetical protein